MTTSEARAQKWIPLESNPMVLNKYVHNLGMDTTWNFMDVFGLDQELLAILPQPVVALMLLYPHEKDTPDARIGETLTKYPADLYYTKQTIQNACGTVAVVHALANNSQISFNDSGHFKTFLEKTKSMNPDERAKAIEEDEKMGAAHEGCAQQGDTQAPVVGEECNGHFITFIHLDSKLYELDGRKEGPVCHGATTQETFAQDAGQVIKKFMARDPDSVNFNVMALAFGEPL